MYAVPSVFQYQTFDRDAISFTPVKPPATRPTQYFGVVSDLPSKLPPDDKAESKEPSPEESQTDEAPAGGKTSDIHLQRQQG